MQPLALLLLLILLPSDLIGRVPPVQLRTAAVNPPGKPAIDRNKFALIISGLGGEEEYVKQFSDWSRRLQQALLEKLNFAGDQVFLLREQPSEQDLPATVAQLKKVFAQMQQAAQANTSVYIFLIGHGSFDGTLSKFNLVGPDISAEEFASLVNQLPGNRLVVVNMASSSGEFLKPLSKSGRVIVTATRHGREQNATRFAEYFITALTGGESDADKNNRISVLEAFTYASRQTAKWYESEGRLATEHALIDDNADGAGHSVTEPGEGSLAKMTFFDSLPLVQAGGNAALAELYAQRSSLEGAVEELKQRKKELPPEEYEGSLEQLFVKLALLNRTIRAGLK